MKGRFREALRDVAVSVDELRGRGIKIREARSAGIQLQVKSRLKSVGKIERMDTNFHSTTLQAWLQAIADRLPVHIAEVAQARARVHLRDRHDEYRSNQTAMRQRVFDLERQLQVTSEGLRSELQSETLEAAHSRNDSYNALKEQRQAIAERDAEIARLQVRSRVILSMK